MVEGTSNIRLKRLNEMRPRQAVKNIHPGHLRETGQRPEPSNGVILLVRSRTFTSLI
jgi:hypothetical protein